MAESSNKNCVLVAAIDFGTTFSGYAYSSYAEFKSDPTKVDSELWNSQQMISTKAPTCILIGKDGKTEKSFGYDAETDYANDEDRDQLYLFRRFKMLLDDEKGFDKNAEVKDVQGKPLKIMTVFSLCIRCIKKKLETLLINRLGNGDLMSYVRWVLTVPAIWSDAAKQFMRQAATEADIPDSKLTIALEPECASLCCRYLKHTKFVDDSYVNLATLEKGTQYMVLDAGGGTVDITIHEVVDSNTVKEVESASGGPWGGVTVDQAFYDFFEYITKPGILTALGKISFMDKLEIEQKFELKKRIISPDKNKPVNMHLPMFGLNTASTEIPVDMKVQIQGGKIKIDKGLLSIDSETCKVFFRRPIDMIINHVTRLLNKPSLRNCKLVVMVGGFSCSPMLQKAVKKAFPEHKVIIPDEADMCVLKGAVMFGHDPSVISERVCRYTYGCEVVPEFDPSKHPEDKRETYEGVPGYRCKDVFCPFVEVGECLKVGQSTKSKSLVPVKKSSKEMDITLFASKIEKPQYVTDEGCHQVGKVIVPLPTDMKRVDVSLVLGGTEIAFECKYIHTGDVTRGYINFLG